MGRPRPRPPFRFMASQLATGAKIQPYVLFLYLNLRIDVFFVAHYHGLSGVGLYSVAVTFAELTWLVTDSVTSAVAERQANAEEAEALDVTLRAVRMNLLVFAVLGVVIACVAPVAVGFVYGDEFGSARAAVWALLPAAGAMAVWRPVGALLLRLAPPLVQSGTALVSLALNVVGNAVLVPRLGLVGAGLASVVSYSFGAVSALVWLARHASLSVRDVVPSSADARQLAGLVRPGAVGRRLARVRRG